MCEYHPDAVPVVENQAEDEVLVFSKVIKTPANGQAPSVSDKANYVDIPENFVGNEGGVVGVAIGANITKSHTYNVLDSRGMYDELSLAADEVYLKVNYTADRMLYAFILYDGHPIKAFDGNYALAFDCEKGTKTLNQKIDLPEGITGGAHALQAVIIQKNNSSKQETFSATSYKTRILINNSL